MLQKISISATDVTKHIIVHKFAINSQRVFFDYNRKNRYALSNYLVISEFCYTFAVPNILRL